MLVLADKKTFTPPGFSSDFQPLPTNAGSAAVSKYVNFNANGDFPKLDISAIASEIDTAFKKGGSVIVHGDKVVVPGGVFKRSIFLVSDDKPYQQFMSSFDAWLAKPTDQNSEAEANYRE